MKIAIVSTSANGGAGAASKRLKAGLQNLGLQVSFISKTEPKNSLFEFFSTYFKKRSVVKYNFRVLQNTYKRQDYFSFPYSYCSPEKELKVLQADVINLHWVSDFVDFKSFFLATKHIPMVITLHDMNYFTGGCHYSFGCEQYVDENCNDCWQLEGSKEPRAAHYAFLDKLKAFGFRNFENTIIVSPSNWLKESSEKSTLFSKFRNMLIPNGINTDDFKQIEKQLAKSKLGLTAHNRLLLFIASDVKLYRKGFRFVKDLLPYLSSQNITLLVVGDLTEEPIQVENLIYLGKVNDLSQLSLCYSCADAMILPTLADNLPNTMLESLCCGTPVLGFEVGGLPDVILNGQNGFLSSKLSSDGLKEVISRFYEEGLSLSSSEIRVSAAEKYHLDVQAKEYKKVFNSLLFDR